MNAYVQSEARKHIFREVSLTLNKKDLCIRIVEVQTLFVAFNENAFAYVEVTEDERNSSGSDSSSDSSDSSDNSRDKDRENSKKRAKKDEKRERRREGRRRRKISPRSTEHEKLKKEEEKNKKKKTRKDLELGLVNCGGFRRVAASAPEAIVQEATPRPLFQTVSKFWVPGHFQMKHMQRLWIVKVRRPTTVFQKNFGGIGGPHHFRKSRCRCDERLEIS